MNKMANFSERGWKWLVGTTVAAMIAAWTLPTVAQTTSTWTSTTTGAFNNSGNWDTDVPGTDATIVFNLPNTYTVEFPTDADTTVARAQLSNSAANVTWNLGGKILTMTFDGAGASTDTSMHHEAGNLTVTNGTLAVEGIQVDEGLVTVTGTGTNMTTAGINAVRTRVGNTAAKTGELRITEGASVTFTSVRIGSQDGRHGIIRVTGNQSTFTQSGATRDFEVARRGAHSELHALDGGHIQVNGIFLVNDTTSVSKVNVYLDGGTMTLANDMDWVGNERVIDTEPQGEAQRALHYTLHTGATNAALTVGGTMTLGDSTRLVLSLNEDFHANVGEVFTLAQADGWSGLFRDADGLAINHLDVLTVAGGQASGAGQDGAYLFRAAYVDNNHSFQLTVIPEPGTLGLMGLAAGMGWLFVRRRRIAN